MAGNRFTDALRVLSGKSPKNVVAKVSIGDLTRSRSASSFDSTPPLSIYGSYFLTSPPVYRAVHLRSEAVSTAPLAVKQIQPDGTKEPVAFDHPLQQTLIRVNPHWTHADLMYATEQHLSLWGSAYWLIDRDTAEEGTLASIWPMRPDKVKVVPDRNGNEYIKGYKYTGNNGKDIALLPEEVLWLRRINPIDEFSGASPVAPGRASFDMGVNALMFNRNFFINDAQTGDLIITTKDPMDDDEYEAFLERLEERHKGVGSAHKPIVIDGSEASAERLGLSQRDMEFMKSLEWTVEDAARVFGILPPLLMDRSHTNVGDVKQARHEFYSSTVQNEWRFIATEITEFLVRGILGESDLVVEFDDSDVSTMVEIRAEQALTRLQEVKDGVLTINEYREQLGRESVDWGDVWWANASLLPVTSPEDAIVDDEDIDEDEELFGGEVGVSAPDLHRSFDKNIGRTEPWPEKFADNIWKVIDNVIEQNTKRFKAEQRRLFKLQEKSVQSALLQVELSIDETGALQKASAEEIAQILQAIFRPTSWKRLFIKRGLPIMRIAFSQAGRAMADEFEIGPFDPNTARGKRFLRRRAEFWQKTVNEETARLLGLEVSAALDNGESIAQMQGRVTNVFSFNDAVRSERIARTEMLASASAGQAEYYDQTEVIERKEWLTTFDDRTRDHHLSANGQVRDKDKPFDIGGEKLPMPGIGGSPGNVINCRCTTLPLLEDQKAVHQYTPETV